MTDGCLALERWLDDGGPEPERAMHEAHASSCPTCARAVASDRAWMASLAVAPAAPRAPAAFTERVLARVALEPRESAPARVLAPSFAPSFATTDPLPWWIRAFAQPASALSFLLLGVAYVLRDAIAKAPALLPGIASAAIRVVAPSWSSLVAPFARAGDVPGVDAAVAFAALPLVALLAYACYAATMALAQPNRARLAALSRRAGP